MNVKKKCLKALVPDYVFRDAKGREVIINSKTTLGTLKLIGAKIHLSGMDEPTPEGAFVYAGIKR